MQRQTTATTTTTSTTKQMMEPKEGLALDDIVIPTPFKNLSTSQLMTAVLNEYNKHVRPGKSAFTESFWRGTVVPRNQFILAHRNEVPELALYRGTPIARELYIAPTVYTEIIGEYDINAPLIGRHGSWVINVPVGHYAKTFSGNTPLLYGPGTHVIHDTNFRFDSKSGLINQNQPFVEHGNYKIIRVPIGYIAKINLNNIPYLLEGREDPYVYNTPYFQLVKNTNDELFYSAQERLIEHGPIKRVMPHTAEIAISYERGDLYIIRPGVETFNSPTHLVDKTFVSTALITMQFPSEETKKARKRENSSATVEEINYEIFTTKDSLKVGVKIMVAFKIIKPESTFKSFTDMKSVIDHIENCANVDMGKAVQMCSSQEFLMSAQNKPTPKTSKDGNDSGTQVVSKHFQDGVRDMLAHDLEEIGIQLVRLSIETPKILNPTIATEMEKLSIQAATANAKQATLNQTYEIEIQQANRAAATRDIEITQRNNATIATANADLTAAKTRAQAIVVEADAQKQARQMLGDQYKSHPELLQLELAKLQAEMFKSSQIYVTPEQMQSMMQGMIGLQSIRGFAQQPFAMFNAPIPPRQTAEVVNLQPQPASSNTAVAKKS